MTVRVGCNLLWIVPGVVGGSEDYTVRLLHALADGRDAPAVRSRGGLAGGGAGDVEVVLFANRDVAAAHPDLLARFEHRVAPLPAGSRALRVTAESTWLAGATRAAGVELVHHAGGTMPAVRTRPGVLTVHDLQPWAIPESFSPLKRAYLRAVVPRSARGARRVITTSAWVRDDVVRRLGVPAGRVQVVAPGLAPTGAGPEPAVARQVLAAYDLVDRPFFLYPAITYPHKDHATLLRAFARARAERHDAVLVLTGGPGPAEGEVRHLVTTLGLDPAVRRPGRIPADHLDVLYRHAVALTFPSRYEGFGLPVLEAMGRGCPVVAGRATGLVEVVGAGGVLVPPGDVAGWAAALRRLLVGADRPALVEAARHRASGFTWAGSAEALAATYLAAAGTDATAAPSGPDPEVFPR